MSVTNQLVTIVVPVYADWPSLKDCIESLMTTVPESNNVMLVNDCGPEVEMIEKNIKSAIKGHKNFSYYRNPKNLGFVGTCNRAVLELDKTNNDILLLNSDTKTTAGWLEELTGVLHESPKHGVVSPRSNNATIATVPLSAANQKGISSELSYDLYKKLKSLLPRYNVAPVAHGFCMLIRRTLIEQFGLFDSVFGKGYGEEVDFCQRIAEHGYKCLIANRAYVFHLEAKSFSLETKNQMLDKNNQIIWQRYPYYRQQVRDYMSINIDHENKLLSIPTDKSVRRLVKKSKLLSHLVARLKNSKS